jgi:hypothetical protein
MTLGQFVRLCCGYVGLAALVIVAGCGEATENTEFDTPETSTHGLPLETVTDVDASIRRGDFCSVPVRGYGTKNLEDDYLPKVVECEHGPADFETLKAQAIAARSIALYKIYDEQVSAIAASTAAQHYNCGRPVSQRVRDAVEATEGQVLTYNDYIVAAFYKAGATRNAGDSTCSPAGGPFTRTESEITHNENRTGANIEQTTIGWVHPSNYANRGAMGQNEALCLERERGYNANQILEYFYGADIRVTQLEGPCFDTATHPSTNGNSARNTSQCTASSSRPDITTRAEWGARAPRGLRPRHTPNQITIHHTETSMGTSNPASIVRGIQNFHMDTRGWNDIAYHYLISADGTIFEGSAPTDRIGSHVGGNNTGNLGIALLGKFGHQQPTDAQLRAAGNLVGWLADKYSITVQYDASNPGAGTLMGHRHNPGHSSNSCPGNNLVAQLDQIEQYATSQAVCDPSSDDGLGEGRNLPTPDLTLDGPEKRLNFSSPDNHGTFPETVTLAVDAAPEIERVVYYAETYEFERSTDPAGDFERTYSFQQKGRRILTAKGYNAAGEFVGKDQIEVRITDQSLTFADAEAGGTYPTDFQWHMAVGDPAIETVSCKAGQWAVGQPTTAANDWEVSHSFSHPGNRHLTCQGLDASGAIVATAELDVIIADDAPGVEILSPKDQGWYRKSSGLEFRARAHDSRIASVHYVAESQWDFGDSTDEANDFAHRHTFSHYGDRVIDAVGYDAQGNEVARTSISIRITDDNGTIPQGANNVVNNGGGSSSNSGSTGSTTPGSYRGQSVQSLATRVMQYHNEGKVELLDYQVGSGNDDGATAYDNIRDAANGRPANTSCYSTAPCSTAYLDPTMLRGILRIYDDDGLVPTINSIAGGGHSSNSTHYYGNAVDVGYINGQAHHRVCGAPVTTVSSRFRAMTPAPRLVLDYCNEPNNHWHHIHADWGR